MFRGAVLVQGILLKKRGMTINTEVLAMFGQVVLTQCAIRGERLITL